MSNIEPTEEQRAAADDWHRGNDERRSGHPVLALFLAEREQGLREQVAELQEKSARRLEDGHAIGALVGAIAMLDLAPGSENDRAMRAAFGRVANHLGALEVKHQTDLDNLTSAIAKQVEEYGAICAQVEALTKQLDLTRTDLSVAWQDCEDGQCRACAKCSDDRDSTIATLTKERDDLSVLFKDANDDSRLAWKTVGVVLKTLWIDVMGLSAKSGERLEHEEIVDRVKEERAQHIAAIATLREFAQRVRGDNHCHIDRRREAEALLTANYAAPKAATACNHKGASFNPHRMEWFCSDCGRDVDAPKAETGGEG